MLRGLPVLIREPRIHGLQEAFRFANPVLP